MRHFLLSIAIIVILFMLLVAPSHTSKSQRIGYTATPVYDDRVFPRELVCDDLETVGIGPTWNEITIGSTLFNDLNRRLIAEDYVISVSKDGEFVFDLADKDKRDLHTQIKGCVTDDKVSVISVILPGEQVTLVYDYVAQYGIPDTVTWSGVCANCRVLFWFEKGIAAEILTFLDSIPTPDSISMSRVVRAVYFPYQSAESYCERWPYNRRYPEYLALHDEFQTQNPFDFRSIIQTITAEPPRTLIPTPTLLPTKTSSP